MNENTQILKIKEEHEKVQESYDENACRNKWIVELFSHSFHFYEFLIQDHNVHHLVFNKIVKQEIIIIAAKLEMLSSLICES